MDAESSQSPTQSRRHWRPRFSLLSALLLMTIVALTLAVVRQRGDVERLRSEVRQLRDEVGKLSIDDPTTPCAIRLLSLDESTWKYRIYVPPGQRYGLALTVNDVPQSGLPSMWRPPAQSHPGRWTSSILPNGHYLFLGEGEHVITVGVARTEGGNRCVGLEWFDVSTGVRQKTSPVEVDKAHWPRVDTGGLDDGVGRSTQIVDSRGELILMRHIVPPLGLPMGNQPMDGFLLWLEPIRANDQSSTPSGADSTSGDR
jgi:hypothetical protein